MESKAPTNHHLLLLRLLLPLVLALYPFTTVAQTVDHYSGSSHEHEGDLTDFPTTFPYDQYQTKKVVNVAVQSVVENTVQHCAADFQCQCPPSACECPLTLEPEALKLLKNNLGPVIRQRLMELLEKTRTVESAIEMADQTIDMLKLLKESNSEFNVVRENMLNGAQQLRYAFHKLGNEMHNVY